MMIMMVIIPLLQRVSSLLYLNLNLFPCYNPYNRKFLHFVAPRYHCLYRIAQFNLSVTLRVNIKDSCSGSCSSQVIFYLYLGSRQVKCLQTPQSVLHFLSLYDSRSIRSSLLWSAAWCIHNNPSWFYLYQISCAWNQFQTLGSILQKVEACSVVSQKTYLALGTIPFPWKFSFRAYKYDFELVHLQWTWWTQSL